MVDQARSRIKIAVASPLYDRLGTIKDDKSLVSLKENGVPNPTQIDEFATHTLPANVEEGQSSAKTLDDYACKHGHSSPHRRQRKMSGVLGLKSTLNIDPLPRKEMKPIEGTLEFGVSTKMLIDTSIIHSSGDTKEKPPHTSDCEQYYDRKSPNHFLVRKIAKLESFPEKEDIEEIGDILDIEEQFDKTNYTGSDSFVFVDKSSNTEVSSQCNHKTFKPSTILHRTCPACQSTIWPGQVHLECNQCQQEVHTDCQDTVFKSQPRSLPDFILPGGVAIPAVLVNCLAVIESRGLETQGLYRVPGNDLKIKALTAKVLSGDYIGHSQADLDVHILCGVVKEFFRSLKYPLIPEDVQNSLIAAKNDDEVLAHICSWDPPYRDTLAFLMLHLQKVAKSVETKMSADNLASMLAMSVFATGPEKEMQLEDILKDNRERRIILETMMNMDPECWKMILSGKLTM